MKRDTRAGSLPYMEAGERMRLSQARLVEARANLRAWRVAAAAWTLTAGYSKAWDAVFVEGLAAITGMDERSVRRGIKECEQAGALQWRGSSGGTHGRPSYIGLPELAGPQKPGQVAHRAAEARAAVALLPSNEDVGNESACPQDGEGWHAERRATPEGRPAPDGYDWEAFDSAVDASWRAANGS